MARADGGSQDRRGTAGGLGSAPVPAECVAFPVPRVTAASGPPDPGCLADQEPSCSGPADPVPCGNLPFHRPGARARYGCGHPRSPRSSGASRSSSSCLGSGLPALRRVGSRPLRGQICGRYGREDPGRPGRHRHGRRRHHCDSPSPRHRALTSARSPAWRTHLMPFTGCPARGSRCRSATTWSWHSASSWSRRSSADTSAHGARTRPAANRPERCRGARGPGGAVPATASCGSCLPPARTEPSGPVANSWQSSSWNCPAPVLYGPGGARMFGRELTSSTGADPTYAGVTGRCSR